MSHQEITTGYLVDFEKAIENQDAPAILRLWEEYTSSEEVNALDFQSILEVVKDSTLHEYIGRHVERAIPIWEKLAPSSAKDRILQLIIDLQMTGNPLLRDLTVQFLTDNFETDPLFSEKMRLIGLRGGKEDFKGAISHFLLLNHMQKSHFVFHSAGWGVGEIMEVSMLREQLSLEFDYVPGRKDMSFKVAFQTLIPISKDHFLAQRFGTPDVLEEKAKKEPVEVIRMLLNDLGPKTAAEIKDELCDLVIPESDWNRWWQHARNKVKKDQQIESPADLKAPFRSLRQEVSHEERLQKALEKKPDADTLIHMVYGFVKDFPETLKKVEFKNSLIKRLQELLSFQEITAAQEIQILFFLQDLLGEKTYPPIEAIFKKTESIEDLMKGIAIQSFKKRFLTQVAKYREDWLDQFLHFFFMVDQSALLQYIAKKLVGSEKEAELKQQLLELFAHPYTRPELVIWYFQQAVIDSSLPFGDAEGRSQCFEAFLTLLAHLEKQGERRELIKKMHGILSAGRYAIVRKLMKEATQADVQEFLLLVSKCFSLSDHDIKIFHSLAEVAHPALARKKKKVAPAPEEEVIWTTKDGYAILQKRIEQIGTVETVENAKEIEIARAHGDLRENAEFKAALERRDRLQTELKTLSDQLNKCRILTKDDVHMSEAGVGTIVDCEAADKTKASYTLLGPWDADPEKNILSFQSKLAQSINGLKKGETFELQGKTYKIIAIRSAL